MLLTITEVWLLLDVWLQAFICAWKLVEVVAACAALTCSHMITVFWYWGWCFWCDKGVDSQFMTHDSFVRGS